MARGVEARLVEWPPPPAGHLWRKGIAYLGAAYSTTSRRRVRAEIAAFDPDVVHVHNFWPRVTPSMYFECRRAGIPVVQSLHNYRILCVSDFLLRDGRPCELCVGKSQWNGARHRCDRGSLSRSVLKAATFSVHNALGTWNRMVDVFIAPSESMRERFVRGGILPDRIIVNPQFAPDPGVGDDERRYFAFVGRLTAEKGLRVLFDAWSDVDAELRIVGEGPLEGLVREVAVRIPKIRYLGALPPAQVQQVMRGAIATIVPSLWQEPAPLVIAESYATSTPVIASDTGSRRETVEHGETGLVFPAGDSARLAQQIRWAGRHADECRAMGRAARARYEQQHSPDAGCERLLSVYRSVLRSRPRRALEDESSDIRTARGAVH
jgi:glycosyltransferase involved in cell wall biosynthesis